MQQLAGWLCKFPYIVLDGWLRALTCDPDTEVATCTDPDTGGHPDTGGYVHRHVITLNPKDKEKYVCSENYSPRIKEEEPLWYREPRTPLPEE